MEFFASYGRVSRRTFWLGTLAIVVGTIVVSLLLSWLGFAYVSSYKGMLSNISIVLNPLGSLIVRVLSAVFAVPLGIARQHDRNKSGIDVVIITLVGMLADLLDLAGMANNIVVVAIGVGQIIGSIYLLVVLGFLPGNASSNAYGRSPAELRAEERAGTGSVQR